MSLLVGTVVLEETDIRTKGRGIIITLFRLASPKVGTVAIWLEVIPLGKQENGSFLSLHNAHSPSDPDTRDDPQHPQEASPQPLQQLPGLIHSINPVSSATHLGPRTPNTRRYVRCGQRDPARPAHRERSGVSPQEPSGTPSILSGPGM